MSSGALRRMAWRQIARRHVRQRVRQAEELIALVAVIEGTRRAILVLMGRDPESEASE